MSEELEKTAAGGPGEKFWNAPNALTLVRFSLVPIFVVLTLERKTFGSLAVFLAAGLTDVLDGLAARTWHQRTRVGTIIDPLADKLLLSAAFILLTFVDLGFAYVLPVWLTAVVLSRDFVIVLGGLLVYSFTGRKEFFPTVFGKMSTVFQVGTVFWVILSNYVHASTLGEASFLAAATSPSVLSVFFFATLALTVISGLSYIVRGIRMAFFPAR